MSNEVENALISSKKAVQFDQLGNYQAASYYYREASKYLEIAINSKLGSSTEVEQWDKTAVKYLQRAKALEDLRECLSKLKLMIDAKIFNVLIYF